MKQEKSCGCIILKDGNVLVIGAHDQNGVLYWSFPKGHKEPGETDIETALRETKEEVGLDVRIVDDEPLRTWHLVHNGTVNKEVVLFISEATSDKVIPQEGEVEVAKWVKVSEAEGYFDEYYSGVWGEFLERYQG